MRERCFTAEERLASVYMGVSDAYEAAGLVPCYYLLILKYQLLVQKYHVLFVI